MKRQLHLNLFFHSRGHHEASWRHPASSPLALTDIRYYHQDLAQRAEAAKFDSIFLADQLALGDVAQAARTLLEPVSVLAALAVSIGRIGMIATASTTYTERFRLWNANYAERPLTPSISCGRGGNAAVSVPGWEYRTIPGSRVGGAAQATARHT